MEVTNSKIKKKRRAQKKGFQRGFLLNSTTATTRKQQPSSRKGSISSHNAQQENTSSDLLQFEIDEQPLPHEEEGGTSCNRPLWIMESKENEGQQGGSIEPILPFHSSHKFEDDGFRIEAISTTTRKRQSSSSSPLVQELSAQEEMRTHESTSRLSNPTAGGITEGERQIEKSPLLVELRDSVPSSQEQTTVGIAQRDNEPAAHEKDDSSVDNSSLRLALSHILWKIQRQSNAKQKTTMARDFVTQHLPSSLQLAFTWDSILEACATREADRNVPEIQLAMAIIQDDSSEGTASLATFLVPTTEKRSRVLALGAVVVVQRRLDSHCAERRIDEDHSSLPLVGTMLDLVFPKLVNIVLDSVGSTRKTILSHYCMMASFEILTLASNAACRTKQKEVTLLQTLYNTMPMIDKLLNVHQSWQGVSSSEYSEFSIAEVSPDASRKQCTAAVVRDWIRLIKLCQNEYQELCLENSSHEDATFRVGSYWALQIGGVQLNEIVHVNVGSLAQTLGAGSQRLTACDVIKSLNTAVGLMQFSREENDPDQVESIHDRECAILRGVTAWLGQSKRNLRLLARTSMSDESCGDASSVMKQAMELLMKLLRSQTDHCSNLVLSCLNHLWSDSEGIPPDLLDQSDTLPKDEMPSSFGLLLDELTSMTSNVQESRIDGVTIPLDPSTKALCLLISRCILRKGKYLLEEMVSRNGLNDSTVEVLAALLPQAGSTVMDLKGRDNSTDEAGKILLDNIRSNSSVRKKLLFAPALLAGLPMELTVPRLVHILTEEVQTANSKDVLSVASASLSQILKAHQLKVERLISILLESLLDSAGGSLKCGGSDGSNDGIGKVCACFCGRWRRELLKDPVYGEACYSRVLMAIGKTMFSNPSSPVPLALFGSVVGDGDGLGGASNAESRRVYLATAALLRMSVTALENARSSCNAELAAGKDINRTDSLLFDRFSPLLLLRRLPRGYYRTSLETHVEAESKVFHKLLTDLCNELDFRLGIKISPEEVVFTAAERRLSAEIAGLALPFNVESEKSPVPCCFRRFCVPTFREALALIGEDFITESRRRVMRAARASLYAACHCVPGALDDDSGNGLLATASFALQVLTTDPSESSSEEDSPDDDYLIQLQTGCIEFFALCFESLLQRNLNRSRNSTDALVAEVSSSRVELGSDETVATNTFHALCQVSSTLVDIATSGKSDSEWIGYCDSWFYEGTRPSSQVDSRRFSPSPRTCLWNSFLVTSQRISEKDGKLDAWAALTCPWMLDWGVGGRVDLDLRHPLCTAAALQSVFVMITRTKSFACLSRKSTGREKPHKGVHDAYKWALESMKSNSIGGGEYAIGAMRTAALKLILAVVTIDQFEDGSIWQGCLGPGELGEILSILRGAANIDADQNVRELATQILDLLSKT